MIIEIPKANNMPIERWTAYMYCEATIRGLRPRQFYIGTRKGMSVIVIYDTNQ